MSAVRDNRPRTRPRPDGPGRRSMNRGSTAATPWTAPMKFVSMRSRNGFTDSEAASTGMCVPALKTTRSRGPRLFSMSSTARETALSSVTSRGKATTWPGRSAASSTTASRSDRVRALIATWWPRSASFKRNAPAHALARAGAPHAFSSHAGFDGPSRRHFLHTYSMLEPSSARKRIFTHRPFSSYQTSVRRSPE